MAETNYSDMVAQAQQLAEANARHTRRSVLRPTGAITSYPTQDSRLAHTLADMVVGQLDPQNPTDLAMWLVPGGRVIRPLTRAALAGIGFDRAMQRGDPASLPQVSPFENYLRSYVPGLRSD